MQLTRAIERSKRTRRVESAEYLVERDGRAEAYEARVFASVEGQIVAIIRNSTSSRQASEALAHQERFLRRILDLFPSCIFAKDRPAASPGESGICRDLRDDRREHDRALGRRVRLQ